MTVRTSGFGEGMTVRLRNGGPVMTVLGPVEHLLLCMWIDELGHVKRQTFSPNDLVAHDPGHLTWLQAVVRLSSRWNIVAIY